MPDVRVSASIMCGRLGELDAELARLELGGVDSIHVDIMDGHFVPNLTFGPTIIEAIRHATTVELHAHMMVTDPQTYVTEIANAGADVYFFHIEAAPYPLRLIEQITQAGMVAGVAVNPSTPLDFLRDVPASVVLMMSVEPGFSGKRWVPATAHRLERARQMLPSDVVIGVDGNVTIENAALAGKLGATLFVCGTSSLFRGQTDYRDAVAAVRAAAAAPTPSTPAA